MLESIHARCRLPHKAYFGAGTRGPAGFGLGRRGRGFAHSERVYAGIRRAAGVAAGGAGRATASIYPPSPPRGGVDMMRNLQCLWVPPASGQRNAGRWLAGLFISCVEPHTHSTDSESSSGRQFCATPPAP